MQMWCIPPAGFCLRKLAMGLDSPKGSSNSSFVLSRETKTVVTPCSSNGCEQWDKYSALSRLHLWLTNIGTQNISVKRYRLRQVGNGDGKVVEFAQAHDSRSRWRCTTKTSCLLSLIHFEKQWNLLLIVVYSSNLLYSFLEKLTKQKCQHVERKQKRSDAAFWQWRSSSHMDQ